MVAFEGEWWRERECEGGGEDGGGGSCVIGFVNNESLFAEEQRLEE